MKLLIKAIIFDMDGLMFDTEALNAKAWKAAGKLHGFEITDEMLQSHIGANTETSKKSLSDIRGLLLVIWKRLQVVAKQFSLITDVHFPFNDKRIGPALFVASLRLIETADFPVLGRVRRD